jgi:hypothetical protein
MSGPLYGELLLHRVPALAAGAIPARRVVKLSANPDAENQATLRGVGLLSSGAAGPP